MVSPFGDIAFEREMRTRRRIANIYNKREEDFPCLKDYNDYLEEVEDMTFSLIEGIDKDVIEAKIAKYEEENYEQIIDARARKAEELAAALKATNGGGNTAQKDINDGVQGQNVQALVSRETGQYAPSIVGGVLPQPRLTGIVVQFQPKPVGCGSEARAYSMDDEVMEKLRAKRGGRAGGWTIELTKKRAFEEAFGCLWI